MKKHILIIFVSLSFMLPVTSQAQVTDEALRAQLALLLEQIVALQARITSENQGEIGVDRVAEWSTMSVNTSCVEDTHTRRIYCVGGRSNSQVASLIYSYAPGEVSPRYEFAALNPQMYASSCAADSNGGGIYCFGGYQYDSEDGSWEAVSAIYHYEPLRSAEPWVRIDTDLPLEMGGMSCVEDASRRAIYCFGGFAANPEAVGGQHTFYINEGNQAFANQVLVFDLNSESIEVVPFTHAGAQADLACEYAAAVGRVYCFGGDTGSVVNYARDRATSSETDQIFSYDPVTERTTLLSETLTEPASVMSCVEASDQDLYCFGGIYINEFNDGIELTHIYQFDPQTEALTLHKEVLPEALAGHSCERASDGNVYCFGGVFEVPASVYRINL